MASMSAVEILTIATQMKASDVHLTVYRPPMLRVFGKLLPCPGADVLTGEDTRHLGEEVIPHERIKDELKKTGQADFSNSFAGIGRYRANIYMQRGSWAVALRLIASNIPDIDSLGLPAIVKSLANKERGMILVTGVTGSGKSTTLAAMINLMNQGKSFNIITLEDPIEYLHRHGTCIINQREVGTDTISFPLALRAALRQDPDVILIGEMRDLETISTALTAAETGHLVLATLHSSNATQTVERIVDVFPPHQQGQVTFQLSNCIEGIISQQLIPRADNSGMALATEVMIATHAVRNLIRENKTHQLYSSLQTGANQGMVTMDKSLTNLYQRGLISMEEFKKRVKNPEALSVS
ncbi:MAG TPA: type IV pilus twitching motility protein PilT [Syntrophomonadaceae bacterium]|nr:type IV pilus twitching motility protein PilT [Syntrophomonadaceae bacterium]